MATEGDKIAAATIAAALLKPLDAAADFGGIEKTQSRAARRAVKLYREILTALSETRTEGFTER